MTQINTSYANQASSVQSPQPVPTNGMPTVENTLGEVGPVKNDAETLMKELNGLYHERGKTFEMLNLAKEYKYEALHGSGNPKLDEKFVTFCITLGIQIPDPMKDEGKWNGLIARLADRMDSLEKTMQNGKEHLNELLGEYGSYLQSAADGLGVKVD